MAMRWILATAGAMAILGLSGCGDECREYSAYTCKQLEIATYNVYFYYPAGTEEYLGVVEGLRQCGAMAYSYASSRDLSRESGWGYVCCLKTSDSACAEKHR